MENIDPLVLQQLLEAASNSTESNSQPLQLIPQEIIDMLAIGIIAFIALIALFLLVFIIGTIRKWRVQSAILNIQKEVHEIKLQLSVEKKSTPQAPDTREIA